MLGLKLGQKGRPPFLFFIVITQASIYTIAPVFIIPEKDARIL